MSKQKKLSGTKKRLSQHWCWVPHRTDKKRIWPWYMTVLGIFHFPQNELFIEQILQIHKQYSGIPYYSKINYDYFKGLSVFLISQFTWYNFRFNKHVWRYTHKMQCRRTGQTKWNHTQYEFSFVFSRQEIQSANYNSVRY
jgi:hypothetical protein